MAITALPESTVRILGSAQVLTSPVSLVKELIDNALDAKASSIDVTIDSTTLRKIEVRDNGHGIAMEDLDALGKRGHTSKLRSFDELRIIGSRSLGFRGEALASAVELGEVNITTKTGGQAIATTVKLQPKGGVESRKPISHPIGTTVCVTKFLEQLAVRKKRALVDSSRTLSKIKELLQAYALARLTVKFSLKIIQAEVRSKTTRTSRGDWSFVPRPNGSIKEAVTQVVGKDVGAECLETSMTFPLGVNSEEMDNYGFKVEAFVVKPDADLSKISKGQFLSIDSRPLTCSRGTMRRIATLYKSYLRSAASQPDNSTMQVKDPFLRLNIICQPGAYDPNIEPAKDDILFEDEAYLFECIEKLFATIYGALQVSEPSQKNHVEENQGFEKLLARRPDSTPLRNKERAERGQTMTGDITADMDSNEISVFGSDEDMSNLPVQKGHSWGFSMSKDYDDASTTVSTPAPRSGWSSSKASQNDESGRFPDKTSLNPWVIAKLNTPASKEPTIHERATTTGLPVSQESSPLTLRTEPLVFAIPQHSSEPVSLPGVALHHSHQDHFQGTFTTATDLPLGRPWSPPPTLESRPKRHRGPDKPFTPPSMRNPYQDRTPEATPQQAIASDNETSAENPSIPCSPPHQTLHTNNSNSTPYQTTLDADLQSSLAFEHRKEEATRARRLENRAAHRAAQALATESASPRSSPHQNRYNAARAALDITGNSFNDLEIGVEKDKETESLQTTLRDGDPRAYFMRRQRSLHLQGRPGSVLKVKRAKSSLLPLETVPVRQMVQNLELEVQIESEKITRCMEVLSQTDGYTREGVQGSGLHVAQEEVEEVKKRLENAARLWLRKTFGDMEMVVEYDLSGLQRGPLLG